MAACSTFSILSIYLHILILLPSFVILEGQLVRQVHNTADDVPFVMDQMSYKNEGKMMSNIHNGVTHPEYGFEEYLEVNGKPYLFESDNLNDDPRLRPYVGNGHIATVIKNDLIHMNGFYNGHMTKSTRAIIPSTCDINITGTSPDYQFSRKYVLNAAEGVFHETLTGSGFNITTRQYAHRSPNLRPLLIFQVTLEVNKQSEPLNEIMLQVAQWQSHSDVKYENCKSGLSNVRCQHGKIVTPETNSSGQTEVYVYYDNVPSLLNVPTSFTSGKLTWTYLTAIHSSSDVAKNAYLEGVKLVQAGKLYVDHAEAWLAVWKKGRIDVDGDEDLARAIYGSYYAILSSLPLEEDPLQSFVGLSPEGLPWGAVDDYWGHVFWDQDTWMYPSVLVLHADLGKILINTRRRTMHGAAENAKAFQCDGLKFPWESAFTGLETSPSLECGRDEVHINGDIAFGIMQYLYMTGDTKVLTDDKFGEILMGIGDYWLGRVSWNDSTNMYDLKGVMPPDEYHDEVDNSVYTNHLARLSLLAADKASILCGQPNHKYKHVADKLCIPFDSVNNYHPEYDGYKLGETVKQADVVMLGYPFMMNMTEEARKNDLKIYENVTSADGPAMTWGMFAIGWLEVKEPYLANVLFKKSYQPYIANEFQVWTEQTEKRGCANFITGAGGFLQAVIFGYGGLRINETHLTLDPELPPSATGLNFTGIDYHGGSFNYHITKSQIILTLTKPLRSSTLQLQSSSGAVQNMELNKPLSEPWGRYIIKSVKI